MNLHLPYERRYEGRMYTNQGACIEYYFRDRGAKETIILTNGWGTTYKSEWQRQLDAKGPDRSALRRMNLFLYNAQGMGRSTFVDSGNYLDSATKDLQDLINQMGFAKVHLVAHSMGGLVQLGMTRGHQSKAAIGTLTFVCSPAGNPLRYFPLAPLLVLDPELFAHSYAEGTLGLIARRLAEQTVLEELTHRIIQAMGIRYERGSFGELYRNFLTNRTAVSAALKAMIEQGDNIFAQVPQMTLRTLIVSSGKDFFVHRKAAEELRTKFPNSEHSYFPKCSHGPMFEDPEGFNRKLDQFFGCE
ncbi:alpha/beta hydrolase [Candidatus Micrarchaeota archaeon]|nr:alpha/beta hydrolase [Candidatus Micrarchaeota archaeon]